MTRITMLLKSSDVMAVRRAVFAVGAQRVVVTSLPRQECAAYRDWYFGRQTEWTDAPVRIDVSVDECHADKIVSAFLTTARAGKIERITQYAMKLKGFPLPILQAA
jgi:nitrogen regulatory protein PII